MSRRGHGDSTAAADHLERRKYRRVSGRTLSSVELAVDDVVASGPDSAAGLADCCWRTLTGRLPGGGCGGGCATAHRNLSSGSSGETVVRADDSTTSPAHARGGGGGGGGGHQRPAVALSNWTMISNSSLKDVDGNDLRDELVGYDDDPTTTTTDCENVVKPVKIANQYY